MAFPAEKAGRAFRDKARGQREKRGTPSLPAAIANAGQSTIYALKSIFSPINYPS
jgi:hypothetical protein